MTLILVAMNREYGVQISDRRLTAAGRIVDDESNKALLVHMADGRLLVGFTGLARAGTFETADFLTDVILKAAGPDFTVPGLIGRFADEATRAFRSEGILNTVGSSRGVIEISLAGFGPGRYHQGPVPGCVIITNGNSASGPSTTNYDFRPTHKFSLKADVDQASFIWAIGARGSVSERSVKPLRSMLDQGRPAPAVVGKGVDLMREWSRMKPARGTVGDQISSIVIPADNSRNWLLNYHTSVPTDTIHHPIVIDATGAYDPLAFQLSIKQHDGPVVVPKVGRNQPCPCGSGVKYKRCHGPRAGGSEGHLIGTRVRGNDRPDKVGFGA